MKSILFCHSGPIMKDLQGNYYGVSHNNESIKRYYNVAEEIKLLMRVNKIYDQELIDKKKLITLNPLSVTEVPEINNITGLLCNRRKANLIIERSVQNSDYIVCRLPSSVGSIALKYAKKYNKPYLIELVACNWDSYWNHSIKGKIMAILSTPKFKWEVKNAENVVYITEKFLQNRYPTNGRSFSCANVQLKEISNSVLDSRQMNLNYSIIHNRLKIISIGAVNMRYKGHRYMIKALRELIDKKYDFEYHIVGGGNNNNLQRLVSKLNLENRVIFHGAISHSQIFSLLGEMHIYVQPSLAEAQGRSIIEAMSVGLPCVAFDTGGIPELLDKNFLVSKKNYKELSKKIIEIVNNDVLDICKVNFNKSKIFQVENLNQKRIEIYNEVFNLRGDSNER